MGFNFRLAAEAIEAPVAEDPATAETPATEDAEPEGPPLLCSYCGSTEVAPEADNGRVQRFRCQACDGTMTSDGRALQPDLIGSPHNHPKGNGDPASGGVPGVWAPVLRREDVTRTAGQHTAMPSRKHAPPEGLHFTVEQYPEDSDEARDLDTHMLGYDHHVLRAHLPEREHVGEIEFSTHPDRPELAISHMRVEPDYQRRGIASAMQDHLRALHPHHVIDHGGRSRQGESWWAQYEDPAPHLDYDNMDPYQFADHMRAHTAVVFPHDHPDKLLPVKHGGYAGFVEPIEGHHHEMASMDREFFHDDPENQVTEGGPDEDPVGHHANLINFIRQRHSHGDLWHHKAPVQHVDLSQPIYATQPHLVRQHLDRYLAKPHDQTADAHEQGDAAHVQQYAGTHHPLFVRHEGNTFAVDGHHRIAAALTRGDAHIAGRVYDADQHGWDDTEPFPYDVTKPGLHKYAALFGAPEPECDYVHDDPEHAFAHALYNHDDGICVATEARRAKKDGPAPEYRRGLGPSHEPVGCRVCEMDGTGLLHESMRRFATPPPAPYPNPSGGTTWWHGTTFDPEHGQKRDKGSLGDYQHNLFGGGEHPRLPSTDDPHGELLTPKRSPHEPTSEYYHHSWNTDLGVHFSSEKNVAGEFSKRFKTFEEAIPKHSRIASAHLHMANPAHFRDEHQMGVEAINWARDQGHRFLPDSDHAHEAFISGGRAHELSGYDHPKLDYASEALEHEPEARQAISHIDDHGAEHAHSQLDHTPIGHIEHYLSMHPHRREITEGWRQHLQSQGHDGIIYGNSYEGSYAHPSAIAFPETPVRVHKWEHYSPKNEHTPPRPSVMQTHLLGTYPPAWEDDYQHAQSAPPKPSEHKPRPKAVDQPKALHDLDEVGLDPVHSALTDNEFRFHVTASWADVRAKAKRIRAEGGVHIVVVGADGIGANVQGDTGVYESILSYVPGSYKVGSWQCGCAWAAYAFDRSPAFKRFEGRMCSHTLALQYEAQARGMFGRQVREDAERPSWLRDKARSRYDRDTGRHDLVSTSALDDGLPADHLLDLVRPPVYAFAVHALAQGADPAAALTVMTRAGLAHPVARTLLSEALRDPHARTAAHRCPDCGAAVPSGTNVCPHCHAVLSHDDPGLHMAVHHVAEEEEHERVCPFCGQKIHGNVHRCPHCGHELPGGHEGSRHTADFAAQDPLGDFEQNPPAYSHKPLPGDQENPASTGFATAADPQEFTSADVQTSSIPGMATFGELHDEPEGALPATDGSDGEVDPDADAALWDTLPDPAHGHIPSAITSESPDPRAEYPDSIAPNQMSTPNSVHASRGGVDEIVAQFQATAAAQSLASSEGASTMDIASAAREYLAGIQHTARNMPGGPMQVCDGCKSCAVCGAPSAHVDQVWDKGYCGEHAGSPLDDQTEVNQMVPAQHGKTGMRHTALKDFSPSERAELIGEGHGKRARNAHSLQLEGTHYQALQAALDAAGDSADDMLII